MSVIQTIQQWSPTLPGWQQDAIRRLFSNGTFGPEDWDDLFALLKSGHGIEDPKGRKVKPLSADDIPAPLTATSQVRLLAIKDLKNVNALAEKQTLKIAEQGLTVIYGANGAGKSGYSRVLKKACRARDQREPIRPDARRPPGTTGRAEATFEMNVDGAVSDFTWKDGIPSPAPLSSVAIFDAHCARAYIDEQNDFSFVPYGLDILERLASACGHLKAMLEVEHGQFAFDKAPLATLSASQTAVGQFIRNLTAATPIASIEQLGTLSGDESARLALLRSTLNQENPQEKAKQLRLRAARLEKLSERMVEKLGLVDDLKVSTLKGLIEEAKTARAAADLAAKNFYATPGQLPGTGGEVWQELFAAARKFAAECPPIEAFPLLGKDDQCPLCQQLLGDGAARLASFDAFIRQEAEQNARAKRDAAKAAYRALVGADLELHCDASLITEISQLNPSAADACSALGEHLKKRQGSVNDAASGTIGWSAISAMPASPHGQLAVLVAAVDAQATELEKTVDEIGRAKLEKEFKELDARNQLVPLREFVVDGLTRLAHQAKLVACGSSIKTNAISAKASQIVTDVVSKELADALNEEFRRLKVGHLQVHLKPVSAKGKSYHKLVIQLPGGLDPGDVLSEGEQRAIAIASFLTEANMGGGSWGLVFDDPVSSLDHRRRERVAIRLTEEASKRQVIVFTHDLYFLSLLQLAAAKTGVPVNALTLIRTPAGFGVASPDLPFDGAATKARVGMLRQLQAECVGLHKIKDDVAYAERARFTYQRLRDAWERAVEEVLLNGVVWRFKAGVSTQSLREVVVEDADYLAIKGGMDQCSRFAHDGSGNAIVEVPEPDEIDADIGALEAWRKAAEARRDKVRQNRPK